MQSHGGPVWREQRERRGRRRCLVREEKGQAMGWGQSGRCVEDRPWGWGVSYGSGGV